MCKHVWYVCKILYWYCVSVMITDAWSRVCVDNLIVVLFLNRRNDFRFGALYSGLYFVYTSWSTYVISVLPIYLHFTVHAICIGTVLILVIFIQEWTHMCLCVYIYIYHMERCICFVVWFNKILKCKARAHKCAVGTAKCCALVSIFCAYYVLFCWCAVFLLCHVLDG